jgi:hypothetical protein
MSSSTSATSPRLQRATLSRMTLKMGSSIFSPIPLPGVVDDAEWLKILNDRTTRQVMYFTGETTLDAFVSPIVTTMLRSVSAEYNTVANHQVCLTAAINVH